MAWEEVGSFQRTPGRAFTLRWGLRLVPGDELSLVLVAWRKAWGCSHPPLAHRMERYTSMPREKAVEHIPLLFIASPSSKDPTWEDRFPGGLKVHCSWEGGGQAAG